MSTPKIHTLFDHGEKINYMRFNGVRDFNHFVDQEPLSYSNKGTWRLKVISANLKIKEGTTWYGDPSPKSLADLENHKKYAGGHLVKEVLPKIQHYMASYLNFLNDNVMPKPKVDYNDRGLGMFSFDRAAMGLVKMHEVNTDTAINKVKSQLKIALDHKRTVTQTKKVFAYFKDKKASLPSLRLYILAGANSNIQGNQMLYVGLAASELVAFMELRGVPVEVNVIIGTSFDDYINLGIVTIKKFQEQLDKNQLLLMTSDPRYFRFRGFKAIIALTNHYGLTIPSNLGGIYESMAKRLVQRVDENGVVFEQSYSLNSCTSEVTRIIENYNQQKDKDEKST